MLVGGFDVVPTSEGGGEHEDGRFGGVKVSKKGIDNFKIEAGIDKNSIFAFGLAGLTPPFESTSDGGA